jgi:short-subunit dehydrogenase
MKPAAIATPSALITGCSTGIGLATAEFLQQKGWQVWPTARKASDLEALKQKGFDALPLDLSDSRSVHHCVAAFQERKAPGLGALINNAGIANFAALEDVSRQTYRDIFEVNVFGLMELTRLLLPTFLSQGYGRIINISSVYGRLVAPFVGVYCGSKFALEALSDALRMELFHTPLAVSIIEPGPIATAFRQNAAQISATTISEGSSRFAKKYQRKLARAQERDVAREVFAKPPEAVAKMVWKALNARSPRPRYTVTFPAFLGAWLARLAPAGLLDLLQAKSVRLR